MDVRSLIDVDQQEGSPNPAQPPQTTGARDFPSGLSPEVATFLGERVNGHLEAFKEEMLSSVFRLVREGLISPLAGPAPPQPLPPTLHPIP